MVQGFDFGFRIKEDLEFLGLSIIIYKPPGGEIKKCSSQA